MQMERLKSLMIPPVLPTIYLDPEYLGVPTLLT